MSEIPKVMKAVIVRQHGDAHAMEYVEDYPVPEAPPGPCVLVKNRYAGLNFIDTYFRKGLYKPKSLPFVVGQEGGGIVVAKHKEDENVNVGNKVVYMAFGSYAEYTWVPKGRHVRVDDNFPLEMAVTAMVQGLTAHYLVTSAHANLMQPQQWCLIYSVASGTGQWAAQMAKIKNYKVIGTCSKAKQPSYCCDELIVLDCVEGKTYSDYSNEDEIVERVMEVTQGVGCHCVLDGVGKATANVSLRVLARRGIWVTFGNASGAVPDVSPLRLTPKSAFMTRPKLNDYIATAQELNQRWEEVSEWIAADRIQIRVDQTFPLDQATQAHLYMEDGKTKGKILLEI